ncbi:MAG: hypothetical protein MN733_31830, partial [Nitrososphaera sp.]|nr:hypothetical protein [Nitrososphaera sp.]
MDISVKGAISDAIRKSCNPVAAAKKLLIEEYRKTEGVNDIRVDVTAALELRRSLVVQAVYERMTIGGEKTGWLEAGRIELEDEEAHETRWYRMRDGIGFYLKNLNSEFFDERRRSELSALDDEAVTYKRFLGSYRQYVPGVGYAVSVRKRFLENQDSFLVFGDGERRLFSVSSNGIISPSAAAVSQACSPSWHRTPRGRSSATP